jgi:hypothetical protein
MIIITLHFIVHLLLNFRNQKPKTEKYFNIIWAHLNENIENHQIQEHYLILKAYLGKYVEVT